MRKLALLTALASASAIGIAATDAELRRGRLMRGPDHWPSWRYGPNNQSAVFASEDDVPAGWVDHPSKLADAEPAGGGQGTAFESANGSVSEAEAARTTEAKSQTITDPAKAAANTGGGTDPTAGLAKPATTDTNAGAAGDQGVELDTDGHAYDPALHAATKSKTKEGKWRMKVGVKRPDPAPGYPKLAQPLDL